jgi:hypothetical protein
VGLGAGPVAGGLAAFVAEFLRWRCLYEWIGMRRVLGQCPSKAQVPALEGYLERHGFEVEFVNSIEPRSIRTGTANAGIQRQSARIRAFGRRLQLLTVLGSGTCRCTIPPFEAVVFMKRMRVLRCQAPCSKPSCDRTCTKLLRIEWTRYM